MQRNVCDLSLRIRRTVASWVVVATVLACGAPVPAPATAPDPATPSPSCAANVPARVADTASVAVSAEVAPLQAPAARSLAEQFVFAQLYETLVRVDCTGRLIPGLAKSWAVDASSHRWTLTLRDSARFWNGDPVTAGDVVAAWQATSRGSSSAAKLAGRLADGATVVDNRTLVVTPPDSSPSAIAALALAIYRPRPDSPWPEGTGLYRVSTGPNGTGATVELLPTGPSMPILAVRVSRDADARDQIDGGVHLMFTDDPRVVSYAESRAELTSIPLAWDRTYAVAVRVPDPAVPSPSASDDLRRSLARDVVRAEARGAEAPFWWFNVDHCPAAPNAGLPVPVASTRIVYERQDEVARRLAERLAALASVSGERMRGLNAPPVSISAQLRSMGTRATVSGLPPTDFAATLRAGTALAFVLSLPRYSLAPCDDALALLTAAPWLSSNFVIVPLIQTRARAIVRRDGLPLVADADGTLRVDRASHESRVP